MVRSEKGLPTEGSEWLGRTLNIKKIQDFFEKTKRLYKGFLWCTVILILKILLYFVYNVGRFYVITIGQRKPTHKLCPILVQYKETHDNSPTRQATVYANICPNLVRGIDHLKDPRLNKGLAFTLEERQALGLHGLFAASYKTQKEQLEICRVSIDAYQNDLNKYLYLAELQDTNERLFFSLLNTNIEKYLPIVYTPTVGLACQKFGLAYRRPRGLFISINDKGHIGQILRNWPVNNVRAIVFTDGERILGLGDLGAFGMGIPVGKLSLYTALAGIKPHYCLPITLDVGTNNEALITDPLYIGLRQQRVRGKEYEEFVDEFMVACTKLYGPNVLLQFEDFALQNAAPLLEKYREKYCTFNDDVQGTAAVVVSGLIAATRITKKKMGDNIYMFLGAGSAANGIANLSVLAMIQEGFTEQQGRDKIFMFDIDGLLTTKRDGGVPAHAKNFGKDLPPEKSFEKAVATIKPTCIVGCSTVGGSFTPAILKQMANNAERPIIFALSNPTSKAECTAQDAYDNTEGRCIYASGSPFPPVKYGGKTYYTGQGNNSYIFPGLALGVISTNSYKIPETMFLAAAKSLANFVSQNDLDSGRIYPPLSDVRKVSLDIAVDIAKLAYEDDLATLYPQPKDFKAYIESQIYNLEYLDHLPLSYAVPKLPDVKLRPVDDLYSSPKPDPKKTPP